MNNAPEKISVCVTHRHFLSTLWLILPRLYGALDKSLSKVKMSVSYRYFGEDVEDEWQNRHVYAYPLASETFGQVFRHGHHSSRDVDGNKDPTQSHQHPWCLHRHMSIVCYFAYFMPPQQWKPGRDTLIFQIICIFVSLSVCFVLIWLANCQVWLIRKTH